MIAFKDVKELLQKTIEWEKDLKDFYDIAELGLKEENQKKLIQALKENHLKHLQVVEKINPDDFGPTKWIRYAGDFKKEDLIPAKKIKKDSTPQEILNHILDYENKLKHFYMRIHENIITSKQKELFESLIKFKDEQIYEIKNLLNA